MHRPTDDELIEFLRGTPAQPIPTPPQCRAWDVRKLVSLVAGRFDTEPEETEELLDQLAERLGGGRAQVRHPPSREVGRPRGAITFEPPHYWVDENLLDPTLRPPEDGWYDPNAA